MAGNSLESLLVWMKDRSRMLSWDAIIAMAGNKVEDIFQATYISHLSQGTLLPVPAGSIEVPDTDISYHFSDFMLGWPTLAFGRPSFENDTLTLSLAVVTGTEVMLQTELGVTSILKLSAYEPLNGPRLNLDLRLTTTATQVQADLAESENVKLTLPGEPAEQRAAGNFFLAWLKNPDNESRVYPLVTFAAQGNPLLVTRRIDVRTQSGPDGAGQASQQGALLLFVTMDHGVTGDFPGSESGFMYLIPDDTDQDYSGTALFSLHLLHRAAFADAVLQLLASPEFEFSAAPSEPLAKMVAKAGRFTVPARNFQSADYQFESDPFDIAASTGAQPLTLDFAEDGATQHWQFPCTVALRYRHKEATDPTRLTATFNVRLEHEFHLVAEASGPSGMEGHLFVPYGLSQEVTPVSGLPTDPVLQGQIKGFIAHAIKRGLLERFSETLVANATEAFLAQCELPGGQGLHTLVGALPSDLAVFGKLGVDPSSFRINPQQSLLAPRERLTFTTEPVREGVEWSLENLQGGNPGTIEKNSGAYQAPPAHGMTAPVHRVLVIARDPSTSQRSTAIITLQASPISISPLIRVCNYGDRVALRASSLGTAGLDWSITAPTNGRLEVDPQGDHFYIAGPKVDGKTYVLDEVVVRDENDLTRSAYVLVRQKPSMLTVNPVEDEALPEGQIRLVAIFDEEPCAAQWYLPIGMPGSIDTEGVYTADPSVPDRFVLVFAEGQRGSSKLEGHLILPLPLGNFPEVLKALAPKP
jgi:hypothetical protein